MARKAGKTLLREWREAQVPKVTQDDLGLLIGRSGTYVRKLENGQLPFTVALAVSVSQVTSIPISALLTGKRLKSLREATALLGRPEGAAA